MRRIIPMLAALLLMLVSCDRQKGMFVLRGTVLNDSIDSILVIGLDERFDRIDTIVPVGGQFEWSFRPDTVTTLILLLPDGRQPVVFARKDLQADISIPVQGDSIMVTGGSENALFQAFRMASDQDTCMQQTLARIDSFIVADPFSEVTPYLIYRYAVQQWNAGSDQILPLIRKMSGNMQDAPFLTGLKNEFIVDNSLGKVYVDDMEMHDTVGVKYNFKNLGTSRDHILVCVWASWTGRQGMDARHAMDSIRTRFADRNLMVTDVSADVSFERWKAAVDADSVPWVSYICMKGWDSQIVQLSKLTAIPYYIVTNETKKILLKTDNVNELVSRLDDILPKKDTKKKH